MERQFTLSSPWGETRRMGLEELASIIDGSPFLGMALPCPASGHEAEDWKQWLLSLPFGVNRFGRVYITVHS